MPHDDEKESRILIQDALQDPLVRIPAPLKTAYHAHQKQLTLKYLLQVNLFAQLAYASYTLADILVLSDILHLLILTKLSYTALIVLITIWMYYFYQNLPVFDLLLPTSIIGASAIWFFNLNQSESVYTLIYQYASLVFIVLANLCVQIRFWPSLITSGLISLMIYIGVYFNTQADLYQIFLFSLIYLPVLTFSLYMSWSSTLKSRIVFLQHTLNEYNRRALERLAHTDSLTGLNNRRCFEYLAQQLVQQNLDQPVSMCLLIFDVDHFKQINDRYGHDIGDQVLQLIAHATRHEMRQQDILARYGGEEFITFLPNTSLDEALRVAEHLRHKIENIVVDLDNQHHFSFSVSIGAAILESCETDLMTLIKQADIALYQAKANGRNRVAAYAPDLEQGLVGEMQSVWQLNPPVKIMSS